MTGKAPAKVTPTSHPLVALFSAAPCPSGSQFRVHFRLTGQAAGTVTPAQACNDRGGNYQLVAGMRAESEYEMRAEIVAGSEVKPGPWLPFHTGQIDAHFPPITPSGTHKSEEGIEIRSIADPNWRNTATDLAGNVVWYMMPESNSLLMRVVPGGRFLVHADGQNTVNDTRRWQVLREVDLLGNTIRETNIGRLAEQLGEHGIASDCKTGGQQCVSGFHHEAIRLPNGHTMVLAGLERMMPAGTQGAKEPVDILGDLILDLDEEFQLVWFWNSFDHMDLKRASLGDEKCQGGPGTDGCTPVFLAKQANGWLHSNSLQYYPVTHDVYVSIPEQDWVIRVDYKDGKGTGKVLWRLGKDGDFTAKSGDPSPWFSYQHDIGFDPKTQLLVIFDDGHRRKDKDTKATNRGQAWKIDEEAKTATLVMNADLGVYAVAVGSSQMLSNGNYSWESGFINPGPAGIGQIYSQTTETFPDGKIVYTQKASGALTYRSFRVANMYDAPRK